MTTSHTSTPWEACGNLIRGPLSDGGFLVAETPLFLPNYKADTAHIVRCVNAHDDLVEACKRLIGSLGVRITDPNNCDDIVYARAALEKATK